MYANNSKRSELTRLKVARFDHDERDIIVCHGGPGNKDEAEGSSVYKPGASPGRKHVNQDVVPQYDRNGA